MRARESIAAWCQGLANVAPPLDLDASAEVWPIDRADAVLCINMVHISPWAATLGLLRGAARVLARGAPLILYGPYRRADVATAESNQAFDAASPRATPNGDCASSTTSPQRRKRRGSGSIGWSRCRPTI